MRQKEAPMIYICKYYTYHSNANAVTWCYYSSFSRFALICVFSSFLLLPHQWVGNRLQTITSESLLTTDAVNEQQLLKPAFHPQGVGRLKDFTSFFGCDSLNKYKTKTAWYFPQNSGMWLHINIRNDKFSKEERGVDSIQRKLFRVLPFLWKCG